MPKYAGTLCATIGDHVGTSAAVHERYHIMNSSPRLGPAERAVYELVERGAIDASHAALYRRPLLALAKHGLVKRLETGTYQAVRASSDSQAPAHPDATIQLGHDLIHSRRPGRESEPPSVAPPEAEPMVTLVARVPKSTIDMLDSIGPSRSKATRAVLARALGSGMRKAVGNVRA